MIDDEYLNGYAKHLGVTASMIYICLCRHADKEQIAFPSQDSIAGSLGIKERTVMEKIKILKKWNIIDIKRVRNKGGLWLNNTYRLLDKSEWLTKPPTEKQHMVEPPTVKQQVPPTVLQQHKDTHSKETHTITKVIGKPKVYGNPEINDLLNYLKEKMEIPRLDQSDKINRQYANLLIRRSKNGVGGVKWLIDTAAKDLWYSSRITSTKDLWYNQVKIVSSLKNRKEESGRSKITVITPDPNWTS